MRLQDDGKWEIAGVQTQFEQIAGNLQLMEQIGKERPERLPQVPGRNIDLIGKFFVALEQDDTPIKAFWTEDGSWQFPFSSQGRSSLPAAYSWTFRNTHDPDITLVAYERVAHDAQVSVSAAIFYCKDGLIRKAEDFSMPH